MSERTEIAWTDATWNPVSGCSHVSPGCEHCYAERLSHRFGWTARPWTAPNALHNVNVHCDRIEAPLHWAKPRRIFVCSMGDLFHEQVAFEDVAAVFSTMRKADWHTFQVLTKRPRRMLEYFRWPAADKGGPNVWLGVTAEDQRRADERIPLLLQVPAAVRFVSVEPMLEEIDLEHTAPTRGYGQAWTNALAGKRTSVSPGGFVVHDTGKLDWVIVGCETGPGARPMDLGWVRVIRAQCQRAGVPLFLKQAVVSGKLVRLPELDGRQWAEWPKAKGV